MHINYGQGQYDLPLSQCPVQHPDLFALSAYPEAGQYDHGQTEWYRTQDAAQQRLDAVSKSARWLGRKVAAFQGDEPIRLGPSTDLWKVIFKYSPDYWA